MAGNSATAQAGDNRLSRNNAAVLLVDHQSGLAGLVRNFDAVLFKQSVLALADVAKHYKLPTILTTSSEQGPNGPLWPEIKDRFPEAPFIPRPGEINAWDNKEFVKAVKDTGRKKLIIAGIVSEVCVAFPTLAALAAGYDVYVVVNASGTFNKDMQDAALYRMQQAGAVLINWFAVACELQRDWRDDGEGLANLLKNNLPEYASLMTSFSATSK